TGFLELALTAAQRLGLSCLEELLIESPLALPSQTALLLQLSVGAPDEDGRRALSIHAKPAEPHEAPWTRHATGFLASDKGPLPDDKGLHLRAWPPPGAQKLSLDGFYERLSDSGLLYQGDFTSLVAAYQLHDELYAEAQLPDEAAPSASSFTLHPALFDSALHALSFAPKDDGV